MEQLEEDVLTFWFGVKTAPEWGSFRQQWFEKNDPFDSEIRNRFGDAMEQAAGGELDSMASHPEGALALIIMLDQFPRNVHRGTPRAFATDAKAVAQSERAIARGWAAHLVKVQRMFLYLPLMHAEDLAKQDRCLDLWRSGVSTDPEDLKFALRHREIIERFGRFPHRNDTLGRESSAEEIEFLKEPMSAF